MGRLDGKTILVTGGSTGIGLATCRRFVDEGARLYVTGRRRAELTAAVEQLGDQATAITGDVSHLADLDQLYDTIERDGARLDVVFANAGGGSGLATIADVSPEQYEYTFGVNVKGTIFTIQKSLPLLNDGSSIIVTGSTSTRRGQAGFGMYSSSKAALRQLVRTWAAELAPRRIRVNLLVPGPTDTPGLRGIAKDEALQPALLANMAALIPLGRIGDTTDVANAALFLASDESTFTTGSELFVDGGEAQIFQSQVTRA
jgi:NAD(P)-dependent dehydrogenase (short-subunit alcohol dehydrogenase family)